jgi:hypothetical protein
LFAIRLPDGLDHHHNTAVSRGTSVHAKSPENPKSDCGKGPSFILSTFNLAFDQVIQLLPFPVFLDAKNLLCKRFQDGSVGLSPEPCIRQTGETTEKISPALFFPKTLPKKPIVILLVNV